MLACRALADCAVDDQSLPSVTRACRSLTMTWAEPACTKGTRHACRSALPTVWRGPGSGP
eukprot:1043763-Pyramimonas_sp.AAC.1